MTGYILEDLFPLFGRPRPQPSARGSADSPPVGEEAVFSVYDGPAGEAHLVTARLVYRSAAVLVYCDLAMEIDAPAVRAGARAFEAEILPRTRAIFGEEKGPSEAITILNTNLESAGGYYAAADSLPRSLNPDSNERKMLVVGVNSYPPGGDGYLSILAHELQHMIHAHHRTDSPAWFNEGLATLSQDFNGYPDEGLAELYLTNPDIGLIRWERDAAETGLNYGAANLFLRYFLAQYLAPNEVARLINLDAGNNLQVFAQIARETRPGVESFSGLAADWAVANVLNDSAVGDGRFAYAGLPGYAAVRPLGGGGLEDSVHQLGADYLGVLEGPLRLRFDGEDAVLLVGALPAQGDWMWWSNCGDGKYSTLTRSVNLRGAQRAALTFMAWYEIERGYDYAYVTVSLDGGQTWRSLPASTTTPDNPFGQNLGEGFTGVSGNPQTDAGQGVAGRWVEETVDLSAYAGQEVQLRFWLVNDAEYNGAGLLLDQICIAEIAYCDGAEDETGGWQAEGFLRTTGALAQEWQVRLAVRGAAGLRVEEIKLDWQNRAVLSIAPDEQAVLVILGASPAASEAARYRVDRLGR